MKRAAPPTKPGVSPPPLKRKLESTTSNRAVANFFTPLSKKELGKLSWHIVEKTLLVGRYLGIEQALKDAGQPRKVAAFDLDDTLIAPTNPSNRWARNLSSWKWWNPVVAAEMKHFQAQGYLIIIFTNQWTISLKNGEDTKSRKNFQDQLAVILAQLEIPISVYAATMEDNFRKPRIGMWRQMLKDFGIGANDIDMEGSFFVGDAAGRAKTGTRVQDHSTCDRDLATNIGIRFMTPDQCFLKVEAEPYMHKFDPSAYLAAQVAKSTTTDTASTFVKLNEQELVIFCGSPGSGKSTYYWTVLKPLGYERVNQDILKSRDRCVRTARDYLTAGMSVAVDNTNADIETRAHWIKLGHEFKIPIRCIRFTASSRLAEHNDAVRALNPGLMNPESREILPSIAFTSFVQRFVPPTLSEGFQDIITIDFEVRQLLEAMNGQLTGVGERHTGTAKDLVATLGNQIQNMSEQESLRKNLSDTNDCAATKVRHTWCASDEDEMCRAKRERRQQGQRQTTRSMQVGVAEMLGPVGVSRPDGKIVNISVMA